MLLYRRKTGIKLFKMNVISMWEKKGEKGVLNLQHTKKKQNVPEE